MAYSTAQGGQIRMYHVTNVPASAEETDLQPPDWTEVRVNVADDDYFDGALVGLPVAFFTTTLCNGSLPVRSPYPRQLANGDKPEEGTNYWRVDVPFNPSNFDIFKMASVDKQIHLLCLDKIPWDEKGKLLAEIMPRQKLATTWDLNKYNKANEYNQEDENLKFFVNVCFINPVSIADGEWTEVENKATNLCHCMKERFAYESHDIRLRKWGEEQLQSSQNECNKLLKSLKTDLQHLSSTDIRNLQQIEYFMQNGIEALQKQWEDLFDQEAELFDESDDQDDESIDESDDQEAEI